MNLPDRKNTFHRDPATAELTGGRARQPDLPSGRESGHECRALEEAALPDEFPGSGRAQAGRCGAGRHDRVGSQDAAADHRRNYGRGRTAVFATGGDWRWQMLQPLEDMTHEMFWRQMLRWLVNDTPTRVVASTPKPVLTDEGDVQLRAEVRDTTYLPDQRCAGGGAHRGSGRRVADGGDASRSAGARRLHGGLERREAGSYIAEVIAQARHRRSWAAM